MKQGIRLLLKPGTFVNQLQWSKNHWMILLGFLAVATLETLMGNQSAVYESYAIMLREQLSISFDMALALVTAGKLILMVTAIALLSTATWMVGSVFGRRSSRKVMFRRMAVVFTVLLGGYFISHLAREYPMLEMVSYGAYVWAMILAYFTIKEQFELNTLEVSVVCAFAFLLTASSWHYSTRIFDGAFTQSRQFIEMAKTPKLKRTNKDWK